MTTNAVTLWVHKAGSFLTPWLVMGLFSCIAWYASIIVTPPMRFFDWRQATIQSLLVRDSIQISNQRIVDGEIIVPMVRLRQPGFIVALLGDQFNSPSDFVVGTSTLLPKGVSKNIRIALHPADFIRTPPGPTVSIGAQLFVSIVYDQGDGVFDWNEVIARDLFGMPVLARFTAI
jgi:hypothetical protein